MTTFPIPRDRGQFSHEDLMWVDITQFESDPGNRRSNSELKEKVLNHRYMTLINTDVLLSSDSPFEPQKGIQFILDIVIGIQSHHNSYLHIMPFLPRFRPLILIHVLNCSKGICKTRGAGNDKF